MRRPHIWLIALLCLGAIPVLAQETPPEPLKPRLYVELASIGVSFGYHHKPPDCVAPYDHEFAVFPVRFLDGKYFFDNGLGLGLTTFEDVFGGPPADTPPTYFALAFAPSVSMITFNSSRTFQYVTVQLMPYFMGTGSVALSYSLVFLPPWPIESQARIGGVTNWPMTGDFLYTAGVGLRVGLGWWFMRHTR